MASEEDKQASNEAFSRGMDYSVTRTARKAVVGGAFVAGTVATGGNPIGGAVAAAATWCAITFGKK
jgi:hypothetical protein